MAPIPNSRVLFNEIPSGYPEPGKTTIYDDSRTIDLETVVVPPGSVLLKTIVLSNDPYIRTRMRDPQTEGVVPAFEIGQTIEAFGVGLVLQSSHPDYKHGDHVLGMMNYEQYSIVTILPGIHALEVVKNELNLPWSSYLGAAGGTGFTAWAGWKRFSKAKKGDVLYVSTGAGPVGSMVIQFAKMDGLKVIASAGSDEKLAFMKEVGADVAINYRTTSLDEILAKEGPINTYWDHVGGETLDLALKHAAMHANFIECGMISCYNNEEAPRLKNLMNIISRRINIIGFEGYDLVLKYYEDFKKTVPAMVARGELKHKEHIYHGLEEAGQSLRDIQTGRNEGKCIILVAES
ncbi:hypothetical protein VNI00_001196 [Paramarasmius palmivorus]|uniref:Enoyl reductase (ER) domain-containing protein n=1 Tax=Paramarasmius palmivorus TaxID=297713 RepID=A0AAW0E820_9AGAR